MIGIAELPWTIPGGQQIQFTPTRIGGRDGGIANVIGSGSIQSENYVATSQGWRINGDGSVEFDNGEFRGDISGSTITGGELHIGGDDATSWHVDSTGLMWSGAAEADKATAPFRVEPNGSIYAEQGTFSGTVSAALFEGQTAFTDASSHSLESGDYDPGNAGWKIWGDGSAEFNDVTARGTLQTTGSGKRIEIGNDGNDQISFYDGVTTYPGSVEVGTNQIEFTIPNNSVVDPVFTLSQFSTWSRAAIDGDLYVTMDNAAQLCQIHMDDNGSSSVTANLNFQCTNSTTTGGWSLRHVLNGSTSTFAFHDDGQMSLQIDTGGIELISGSVLRIGDGAGFPGSWSAYEGMFHEDLSSGYMMMSNGTDTFIGADSNVYIRPGGNSAPDVKFSEDGTRATIKPDGLGAPSAPNYAFEDDSDTGMYLAAVNDLRFCAAGSVVARFTNSQTYLYDKIYASGLTASSTTSGNPVWHYTAGGDELYEYTSTGRLKKNVREALAGEGRNNIMNLQPKRFDAMWEDANGTKWDVEPDDGNRNPKHKGQTYDLLGLIAEDVAEDFPDACIHDANGDPRNIDWNAITTSLIQVVQEMDSRLATLEAASPIG